MKTWVAPFIILWAVTATAAAVFFAVQEPQPAPTAPDSASVDSAADEAEPSSLESYADRSTRRLRRRVEQLSAALAGALPSMGESVTTAAEDGIATEAAPAPAERLLSLMDELRRLEDGDEWTSDKWSEISREQNVLLAQDPATHLALMERLKKAPDEDAAHDVLSLLTENPFTQFIHDRRVTDEIHAAARELLEDPRPHIRAAAARVLYAYGSYTRDDVLAGLARLGVETDSEVWDDLLGELSVAAKGYGLTVEELRPLIDGMREHSSDPDGGWAAASLAQWSTTEADLRHITTLLRDAKGRRAQEILNAFNRDTRLAGAHEAECRHLLMSVVEDGARDGLERGLAADFLRGYAPWDQATADVARRYGEY